MISDDEIRRRLEGFENVWQRVAKSSKKPLPAELMPRRKKNNPEEEHLPWMSKERQKYNK